MLSGLFQYSSDILELLHRGRMSGKISLLFETLLLLVTAVLHQAAAQQQGDILFNEFKVFFTCDNLLIFSASVKALVSSSSVNFSNCWAHWNWSSCNCSCLAPRKQHKVLCQEVRSLISRACSIICQYPYNTSTIFTATEGEVPDQSFSYHL